MKTILEQRNEELEKKVQKINEANSGYVQSSKLTL